MDGIEHTVEVTASTLYEAVAVGLKTIRENGWSGEIPEGLNKVRVKALNIAVEHQVNLSTFNRWLEG